MTILKHNTKEFTYYECETSKGVHLFSFTLAGLLKDLLIIYKIRFFQPINLN